MNLKKCLFSAAFVLLFSAVFAQPVSGDEDNGSKFYIKAYGGYSLFNPGSYRLQNYSNTTPNTLFTSKNGLGLGVRAGGGIGVIASDFLNVGVDFDYLSASTLNGQSSFNDGSNAGNTQARMNYNALSITPNLVFKAISKPDYLIYNRIGLLLNLPMDVSYSRLDTLVPTGMGGNNSKTIYNGKYKFGMTAGLNVALGVQIRLTDKLRGFGELFGHFISLLPKQYDLTITTIDNGVPEPVINKHTTYVSNGTVSTNSTPGPNYVASLEDNRFNMNTIGINIGLTYRF